MSWLSSKRGIASPHFFTARVAIKGFLKASPLRERQAKFSPKYPEIGDSINLVSLYCAGSTYWFDETVAFAGRVGTRFGCIGASKIIRARAMASPNRSFLSKMRGLYNGYL